MYGYGYRVLNLLHVSAQCAMADSARSGGSTQIIPPSKAILMAFEHGVDMCHCITEGR